MSPDLADVRRTDVVFKVGQIHSFGDQRDPMRALAVRDGAIVATTMGGLAAYDPDGRFA